jgi:adenosine deaminase CECR1
MVGKETMGLYGWKQLILWSLEHACMCPEEYRVIRAEWENLWLRFLQGVVDTYGADVATHFEMQ